MLWGKNAPDYQNVSLQAKKGSNEYIVAVVTKFYPGSWLPYGEEQILRVALPYFEQISHNNGRLDYIETIEQWDKAWNFSLSNLSFPYFSFAKLVAMSKLIPRFLTDRDFRYKMELLRGSYNKECFQREIIDHQRMVFQRR
jgi:cyclopropane-fatty-acyl-phospholipid synthase